jgi:hypothetical protein
MSGRSVDGAVRTVGVVGAGDQRFPLAAALAAVSRRIEAPCPVQR